MAYDLDPVPMSRSYTVLTRLMAPNEANVYGNVHGGYILKYIDETAAVAALRHSQACKAVTASIERMDFREPVFIGDILRVRAVVRVTGRSSMVVGVRVEAEHPATGVRRHTGRCYITFVALDEDGKTVPVPPVVAETEEEKEKQDLAQRVYDAIQAARREQDR